MSEAQADNRRLMSAILRQAMDDYIKMQHPRRRQKKYEKEAFWSAKDLLFNPKYELDINDENGDSMSLTALAQAAADRDNVDIPALREYLIRESKRYWSNKNMKAIDIPEDVIVEGHAYAVQHHVGSYVIDFDSKCIYLNKQGPTVEEEFTQALIELSCHHGEIRTSSKARKEIGKSLYRILQINNCFVGSN